MVCPWESLGFGKKPHSEVSDGVLLDVVYKYENIINTIPRGSSSKVSNYRISMLVVTRLGGMD